MNSFNYSQDCCRDHTGKTCKGLTYDMVPLYVFLSTCSNVTKQLTIHLSLWKIVRNKWKRESQKSTINRVFTWGSIGEAGRSLQASFHESPLLLQYGGDTWRLVRPCTPRATSDRRHEEDVRVQLDKQLVLQHPHHHTHHQVLPGEMVMISCLLPHTNKTRDTILYLHCSAKF